ncbi:MULTISPECIES: formate dehydrogenase accessory protein FdhE [Acetobacter]|jgi:FdhE protein|uniref:FdhE protein n=1 Tax=Acetobacter lovaniensis TaxID=104100 RepID=A0A841QAZ1_9PROT|nr:formate dehydrogenase accessory protein FdhE [Acetobacter lovaniensis]MBB6455453.1 FdhE protein [Acetobacter lovaniensis]MCI1697609.1 formate dehydrogenase accessory protein FdhE [Acetobacter lovaniensis]MCP1238708.1 formate dehydrogenase accessory protein FdhE [Acetobacter lovaniensis]NHN79860.1 formate dehydrogenase accessory protein FdhE [Acetobacter lovaniensis]GBQ69253.1 formate dehydrogenase accessory protein [Acetobacter lovaniensis NRIC 0474]
MLDSSDIVAPDKRTPGVVAIDPAIYPMLDKLYARRIERLKAQILLQGENGEYFRFLTHLVQVQQDILAQTPLEQADVEAIHSLLKQGVADTAQLEHSLGNMQCWQAAYTTLTTQLAPMLPQKVAQALGSLSADRTGLTKAAAHLLQADYAQVDAGVAVVLWAALSTCWAQAVTLKQGEGITQSLAHATYCPCCHAPPVASLVMGGAREGLRYLQCSLCEVRWHRVRAVCVACDASGQMDHWTLDDAKSAIQIETCGDCRNYIKTLRLDYDPELEAVADDLGSLLLDSAMEAEGFMRIGINPFSFPA